MKTALFLAILGTFAVSVSARWNRDNADAISTESEEERGEFKGFGGSGDFGRRGGHHLPAFLQNQTDEAKTAFFTIVKNENLTIADQKTQINAWAQTYGVSAEVNAAQANITAKIGQIDANATNLLNSLSAKYAELKNIFLSETETRAAKKEQIAAFIKANPQVSGILFHIIGVARGDEGHRGGPGGFPGHFDNGFNGSRGNWTHDGSETATTAATNSKKNKKNNKKNSN